MVPEVPSARSCFNPRRPRGRRLRRSVGGRGRRGFNPRRPRGRRRRYASPEQRRAAVSIHAAREGGDRGDALRDVSDCQFQSTPPARAATGRSLPRQHPDRRFNPRRPRGRRRAECSLPRWLGCFNPRRPRGRRPSCRDKPDPPRLVSIHAAREGGDCGTVSRYCRREFQSTPPARAATPAPRPRTWRARVSIHAAREGGDHGGDALLADLVLFQSTPPARAATAGAKTLPIPIVFQSTPPARAATLSVVSYRCVGKFQSTPPARAATQQQRRHALPPFGFNPRRPRGRRPIDPTPMGWYALFQSTPPARAATAILSVEAFMSVVSIHAAREGGDANAASLAASAVCFNPRRPRGRRQSTPSAKLTAGKSVSIHAAREGGDKDKAVEFATVGRFNPRRPRGRRPNSVRD